MNEDTLYRVVQLTDLVFMHQGYMRVGTEADRAESIFKISDVCPAAARNLLGT